MPSPLRLLVVDDDEPIRVLIEAVFRRRGVTSDCAGDGQTALSMIAAKPYDVVILDLMLPRTNGFQVIRELKAVAPEMLDRVIVLTAVSESTLRTFADGHLVRRVMRKPFDLTDFVDEVLACGGCLRAPASSPASCP